MHNSNWSRFSFANRDSFRDPAQQNLSTYLNHEQDFKVGDKAYRFEGKDINGATVKIEALYTILLFFNATYQSCIDMTPHWEELYRRLSPEEIAFIGIADGSFNDVREFINQHGLTFRVMVDIRNTIRWEYRVRQESRGEDKFLRRPCGLSEYSTHC